MVWTCGENGGGSDGEEEVRFRSRMCEVERKVAEGLNGEYKGSIE